MDERDVVRDLVAKLIEAVEASLDGSPAVREALDELVRNGFEPRLILLADATARSSSAEETAEEAPEATDPEPPTRIVAPTSGRRPRMTSRRRATCATS